ncbi:hypothetical protein U1Q18_027883, partial [Sarracenia purpurea var. burkii]
EEVEATLISFFSDLFQSTCPTLDPSWDNTIQPYVAEQMNEMLTRSFDIQVFEVNLDRATKKNCHNGIGVVIRDNKGRIIASMAEPIKRNNDCDL